MAIHPVKYVRSEAADNISLWTDSVAPPALRYEATVLTRNAAAMGRACPPPSSSRMSAILSVIRLTVSTSPLPIRPRGLRDPLTVVRVGHIGEQRNGKNSRIQTGGEHATTRGSTSAFPQLQQRFDSVALRGARLRLRTFESDLGVGNGPPQLAFECLDDQWPDPLVRLGALIHWATVDWLYVRPMPASVPSRFTA